MELHHKVRILQAETKWICKSWVLSSQHYMEYFHVRLFENNAARDIRDTGHKAGRKHNILL